MNILLFIFMLNRISACMIVKDGEEYLENCLNSIKDLASEIIIVDTGSKDKTKEIAERFTNKVFDLEWNGNFSEARNFAISKAEGDWILSIDADETISGKDIKKIRELFDKNPEADAFLLNCRTYTNDIGIAGWRSSKDDEYEESKNSYGYYASKLLRLFKNKKSFFFEGKIHETPHDSIKKINGRVYDTDVIFHHFGALDKEKLLNKKGIYANSLKERLEKKDFFEKTEDYICFELGRELINLGKIEDAIYYFERAKEINEKFEYLLALGGLYLVKNRLDEAEKILSKAKILDSKNASLYDNLGVIYAKKKEFSKAIECFKRAIELNPLSADAHFNLGLSLYQIGEKDNSNIYFNEAVNLNPRYEKKIRELFKR